MRHERLDDKIWETRRKINFRIFLATFFGIEMFAQRDVHEKKSFLRFDSNIPQSIQWVPGTPKPELRDQSAKNAYVSLFAKISPAKLSQMSKGVTFFTQTARGMLRVSKFVFPPGNNLPKSRDE